MGKTIARQQATTIMKNNVTTNGQWWIWWWLVVDGNGDGDGWCDGNGQWWRHGRWWWRRSMMTVASMVIATLDSNGDGDGGGNGWQWSGWQWNGKLPEMGVAICDGKMMETRKQTATLSSSIADCSMQQHQATAPTTMTPSSKYLPEDWLMETASWCYGSGSGHKCFCAASGNLQQQSCNSGSDIVAALATQLEVQALWIWKNYQAATAPKVSINNAMVTVLQWWWHCQ